MKVPRGWGPSARVPIGDGQADIVFQDGSNDFYVSLNQYDWFV